jgi:hypothetical protein
VAQAAAAATLGVGMTAQMESQAGRSNYISQEVMRGTPDPGAHAIAVMFAALASAL